MRHLLMVNGLDGPLRRGLGCDCGRCLDEQRQANTSVSLLTFDEGEQLNHHLLFDIGSGVMDSLLSSPWLAGRNGRLDALCLTHWHPDHTAELNQLLVSRHIIAQRDGRSLPPVPLYCRSGTADWLRRYHEYELRLTSLTESGENEPPGTVLPPVPLALAGVTVTPVAVSHYTADKGVRDGTQARYACAAYVIETAETKAVLLWDVDSSNTWLAEPETPVQETAVAALSQADFLFVDTALWRARPNRMTHPSFDNVRRYARTLTPQRTYLMHLSGHPDGRGNPGWGWTNERWQTEAQAVWVEAGLPGEVFVPAMGQTWAMP